jgi:hypothetical protein
MHTKMSMTPGATPIWSCVAAPAVLKFKTPRRVAYVVRFENKNIFFCFEKHSTYPTTALSL